MPTFTSLTRLKQQLKSNARAVPSELGGARYGHLGLVLTPAEYALVSNEPYELPAHPGTLVIPCNTDVAEAVRQNNAHYEKISRFRESLDVQGALVRQIVAAIDREYLDALRDDAANTIILPIPEILDYLFENFADVSADKVLKEEERLSNTFYDVKDPLMVIFRSIDDFQLMAKAAEIPKSQQQLVALRVGIIQKTGDFEKGLSEWFAKNANEKRGTPLKSTLPSLTKIYAKYEARLSKILRITKRT